MRRPELRGHESSRPKLREVLLVTAGVVVVAATARRVVLGCGPIDFERMIERMPETAPPKWMYRNISAIRANTDRILEVLEADRALHRGMATVG